MKKFSFSLDRALAWRRSERELAQAALGRLLAERDAISRRAATIRDERANFQLSLATALHFDGGSVPTLPQWQGSVSKQLAELAVQLNQATIRVEQQLERVRSAEQKVKLLEKLRERRLGEWKIALSLDEETQAAEAFLARLARLKRQQEAGA